jgi:DNA polymerase V
MKHLLIPLMSSPVSAGFPSPAEDFIEASLDLNDYLIAHPAATFFVRVKGDSMENAGILNDDILIVDRSSIVINNDIVVAAIDGSFTVKRYFKHSNNFVYLYPENSRYKPIRINRFMDFQVFGVVVAIVRKFR